MIAGAPERRRGPKALMSALLLALQIGAATFFIFNGIGEVFRDAGKPGFVVSVSEAVVAIALLVGIGVSAANLQRVVARGRERDAALAMAQGAFSEVVTQKFQEWKLSPTERDVALLSIKGYSIAEIAEMRGAARGTVRSQLSQVYAKADVGGQPALAALFIERLLDSPISEL